MTDQVIVQKVATAARTFMSELQGRVSKYLVVPEGKLGVVIYPSGESKTFPPGRHQILNPIQRLMGAGVGLMAGYVPEGAFQGILTAEYLLSGSGDLVNLSLVMTCRVADPLVFFKQWVSQTGRVAEEVMIQADEGIIHDRLQFTIQQFTANDLIQGQAAPAASLDLLVGLQPLLKQQGIELVSISLMTVIRSSAKVEVQEEIQKLEERLQDVELQKQLAAVENQAALDDFIRQFAPNVQKNFKIQFSFTKSTPQQPSVPPLRFPLSVEQIALISKWTGAEPKGAEKHNVLKRLFGKKVDEKETARVRRNWWVGRAIWMAFVALVALGLTRVVDVVTGDTPWLQLVEIYIVIWAFGLGALLESVRALYDKREKMAEAWSIEGITHLDDIVGHDRQRIDSLVREECARELGEIEEIMGDVQTAIYRQGNEELALQIRQFRTAKLQDARQKVSQPDFGAPPYQKDFKISRGALDNLWDYDEDLLLHIQALVEKAQIIQMGKSESRLDQQTLEEFERDLDYFMQRFAARARPLKLQS